MNKIRKIIEKGESQNLEFKINLENIGKSICSFANSNDGIILVGVDDKGNIIGTKKRFEREIANISHTCKPSIYPEIKEAKINNRIILVVKVKKSDALHSYKNIAYKRIGSHDNPLSPEEIIEFAKDTGKIRFDEDICEGSSIKDIDQEKVKWFLSKAKFERRLEIGQTISLKESLERLNLIKGNKITNAAILLFGKNSQKFFSQAETRCARFKGTEPLEFVDMKVFGSDIISQREDSLQFVKEHIKLHAEIKGTERVEKWEYPIEAIREAITNAVCHRDYQIEANVQIRIFDDRLEVWGCGSLPKPLTIEDLKKKHNSVLRNQLVGKCFFLIKFIEQWGTGTNRIISECLKHNLPEPLFEEISENLVVTFRKYFVTEDILKSLKEEEKIIVDYIKKHNSISRKECVKLLKISPVTAFRYFKSLENKGLVKREGKGKSTFYTLK